VPDNQNDDVTGLLRAWSGGDLDARDHLFAVVYKDLRRRAGARMRRESAGHTWQPTALVHEAFLRLVDQPNMLWENRAQFLAVASEMMRRILVDHARARNTAKRSGRWTRVAIDERAAQSEPRDVDLLSLDEALRQLAEFDPRKSQVAALRFFGGMSLEETGQALGISVATVERDWQAARAWLFLQLKGGANR
jgi:RNA polymerase sigma-70 factor (ECF subfamily)